jgi:hypothetical protein
MSPGDAARIYHRLSSYRSADDWRAPADDTRVLADFETDDLATFPSHCKAYPEGLPRVQLPRQWPSSARTGILDLAQLARLLHLSAGVLRTAERSDGRRFLFRASGSAGGLFPLELYVAARDIEGLADGVYWFEPLGHALVMVGPPPRGEATTLVVTGVPWRTGWRYAERGFRHLYWDAGAVLANTLAVAQDAVLSPRLYTGFPDHAVTRLVGADGVQEFPLAVVTLGGDAPAIDPGGHAAAGAVDRNEPIEFPLITETQRAGDAERLGSPRDPGTPAPLGSTGIDELVLRRISTRVMDPRAWVGRDVLERSLAASLQGCRLPHFVAAHAVTGLRSGLYRWPSLDNPLRRGDLRAELYRLCVDQDLGRDASFVVIAAVEIDKLDDRGYREAQLEAGLVDGRLHLAASALGIGASGMTLVDSRIPGLLGEPLTGLLVTCVGVPTYRHRPGGPPGAPVQMRPLAARAKPGTN